MNQAQAQSPTESSPQTPRLNYAERVEQAIRRTKSPAVVGLDPHLALLPEPYGAANREDVSPDERVDLVRSFLLEVLDLCAGQVPAVKPQSAFFELLGAGGAQLWEDIVAAAHERGLLVIGDVKRGDIASTAAAYAQAYLEGLPGTDPATLCDAITLSPYLGSESIEPFLDICDRTGRGIYVLVRTSNPGSRDFQLSGEPTLSMRVAKALTDWGAPRAGNSSDSQSSNLSCVGAVVGATHPEELESFRAALPHAPLLLPGYGAQGASANDIAAGFLGAPYTADGGGPCGALVNSSRGILFANRNEDYEGKAWQDATRLAIEAMNRDLRAAWATRSGSEA